MSTTASRPTRPKLQGVRNWFRKTFRRSSSQRPPPVLSPQPPQPPQLVRPATTQPPLPVTDANRSRAPGAEPGERDLEAPIRQRPVVTQIASAPPAVSTEDAVRPSIDPADARVDSHATLEELDAIREVPVTTDEAEEQDVPPETDQRPAVQSTPTPPTTSTTPTEPDSPPLPVEVPVVTNIVPLAKIANPAWSGLQRSLQNLRDAAGTFGLLASGIDMLLGSLGAVEVAARSLQDYEELAIELASLSDSISEHFKEVTTDVVSKCVSTVATAIKRQAAEIKSTDNGTARPLLETSSDEVLMRHFRRIQPLFQQLQDNLSLSAWSATSELLVNARMEALHPETQATYDSDLSTSVNRRTCTEGTRTDVLSNLVEWVYDQDAPAVYWMDGMVGTGKTTIACTFSEWLDRHEFLGASFFCTRTSTDCRDAARIVPTIVHQLARYSASFQSALYDVLSAESNIGSATISKQFELLLKEPIQKMKGAMLGNLVVVIDALDECDNQTAIKALLDTLFQYAQQFPFKFFVTSRPEPEICEKMSLYAQSRKAIHLHDIEKSLVRADIERYLADELAFLSPSPSDIELLVEHSGALFIYATTLVRFIQPVNPGDDPHKRLRSVLGMAPQTMKEHTRIDALYTAVLNSALDGQGAEELKADMSEDTRAVLRTILLAQEPINVETIIQLANIDDSRQVEHVLPTLRSVLQQSKATGLVSTLHSSFPDFMFDSDRSESYFCDVIEHSQLLAEKCFRIMEEQLRFNICDLETSFIPDNQVDDMRARIKTQISPSLTYACRHWANHLHLAPKSDDLLKMLDRFLSHHLLFWMEVVSVRRELAMGIEGLIKAKQWLLRVGYGLTDTVLFAEDARQFLADYTTSPVSRSTPHIYISLLPFCQHTSLVYQHYWARTHGLLELRGNLTESRGPTALATWRVDSPVRSVAYSPDGSRVAVGCGDGTINIRNAYDGTLLVGPLRGHTGSIRSVTISPDCRLVASGSWDKTIRVWNANNGTLIAGPFQDHTGWIYSVSFSPDSTRVASGSQESTIRVWNGTDRTLLGPIKGHSGSVYSVTFSPCGTLIASASADSTIRLWNSQDGTPAAAPFQGHTRAISSIVFTPDGTRLVSGSNDNTIRVWNTSNGSLSGHPFEGHTGNVNSVAVSPDGKRVVSGSDDRTVRVWNIDDGTLVASPFFGHTDRISSVAYSPDGTRVISGSWDKTVRVWDIRDRTPLLPTSPSQDAISNIHSIISTSDGRILSSSADNIIRIWDPSDGSFITGQDKARFFPAPISDASPDRSYIACTSEGGKFQIMSTADGSLAAGPFEIKYSSISAFRFSHDSSNVIIGCKDGTIQVQGLRTRNPEANFLSGHGGGVTSITQSSDCSLLVSYSDEDKTMRVWNMLEPTLELDFDSETPTRFSLDYNNSTIYDGWHVKKDGWVRNGDNHLLFWLPPNIASIWKSPYTSLIITKSSTLQIPKQKLFVGNNWSRCYAHE